MEGEAILEGKSRTHFEMSVIVYSLVGTNWVGIWVVSAEDINLAVA